MKLSDIMIEGYNTLLLDRDGTINVHIIGGYVRKWEDFEFIPGVLDAIHIFTSHFKHIFIVTNQRGISKGLYSDADLSAVHSKMLNEIERAGGRIDKIYYCTSLSEDDIRRKPGRGMFDDILRDFPDVNPATTLMIGDSEVDIEFAKNCGIDAIMIDSLKREGNRYYWINA